jgi:NTP pyrophosphatase (non-canonical NTP hydrolase)
MMTLDEYQAAAERTALYPEKGERTAAALAYCALGLGEAGEVQGKIKKYLRGDFELTDAKIEELALELGDLLWYVAMLSREIGIPLGHLAGMNLQKLARRKMRGTLQGDGDHR